MSAYSVETFSYRLLLATAGFYIFEYYHCQLPLVMADINQHATSSRYTPRQWPHAASRRSDRHTAPITLTGHWSRPPAPPRTAEWTRLWSVHARNNCFQGINPSIYRLSDVKGTFRRMYASCVEWGICRSTFNHLRFNLNGCYRLWNQICIYIYIYIYIYMVMMVQWLGHWQLVQWVRDSILRSPSSFRY